jgi:acyl-CoA hydrolase
MVNVSDLNPSEHLYGGQILKWIDEAASIYAFELLEFGTIFVTLKISEAIFEHPALLGDVLTFKARVEEVGHTSFTIQVKVSTRFNEILTCSVVLVTVDETGKAKPHGLSPSLCEVSNKA